MNKLSCLAGSLVFLNLSLISFLFLPLFYFLVFLCLHHILFGIKTKLWQPPIGKIFQVNWFVINATVSIHFPKSNNTEEISLHEKDRSKNKISKYFARERKIFNGHLTKKHERLFWNFNLLGNIKCWSKIFLLWRQAVQLISTNS